MIADFKCLKGHQEELGAFSGGPVVKNLPAKCRGHNFDLWSKKIPHTVGQLNPDVITTELAQPRAHVPQQEKPLICNWRVAPVVATRESRQAQ